MRMITGFLPPSGGSVTVGGFDLAEHPIQARRLIGYLPGNAPAYTDMTVHGFLNFAAEIRGLRGNARKTAARYRRRSGNNPWRNDRRSSRREAWRAA